MERYETAYREQIKCSNLRENAERVVFQVKPQILFLSC